ncbi:MAG: MBL fold metallo-hydrolase [Eubacteriales bacterium]|nr:MBL fold metallo-hydrolase [Eubacteriales bacterium]
MELTFLGAAREVTGSRYFLEACGKRILIDYGMEQGANVYDNALLPVAAADVDYVFLTHAHIDHSGWLPLLYKQGFRGKIFSTEATHDLCAIMLLDSAHIQEMDVEWKNRKAKRRGDKLAEALYTVEDARSTLTYFAPCKYDTPVAVCNGIVLRLVDVGHLLGSASVEITVTEAGKTQKIVFSGDIGNLHQPLLRDPEYITQSDYVIMESTYGDRSHGEVPDYVSELVGILTETFARGGNVVIPSFAVGRTQELLYFFRQIKQDGLVKSYPHFPVYVDSPLAIEATDVFNEHMYDCMDAETLALVKQGINPIRFDDLRLSVTAEDSKAINFESTPKVIISASGMCDAGRIRHHLKHNLWRPESTVLFVGFQGEGTLGRLLTEGAKKVTIFGEPITVSAEIRKLAGISGHADENGLLKWIGSFTGDIRHVFVTHGEDSVAEGFAKRLHDDLGRSATAPYNGECWDLTNDVLLREGNHLKVEPRQPEEAAEPEPASKPESEEQQEPQRRPEPREQEPQRWSGPQEQVPQRTPEPQRPDGTTYGELLMAALHMNELVEQMKESPKKNQNKLAAALLGLIQKYGRR